MSIAPRKTPVPTSRPAAGSRLVTHLEGTVIARVGDPVKCLFVLVKGQLEIVDPKSQVQTLTRVPEVARTAQVEAIDRGRWTANIIARSEVAVMPLDFVSMHALMERVKKDADLSLEQMRGRLREALRQVSLRDGRICELEMANEELDGYNRQLSERHKQDQGRIAEIETSLMIAAREREEAVTGATLDAIAATADLRRENERLLADATRLEAEVTKLRSEMADAAQEREQAAMTATLDAAAETMELRKENGRLRAEIARLETEVQVRQAAIDSWEEVGTGDLEPVSDRPSGAASNRERPTLSGSDRPTPVGDPNSWADLEPISTRGPMPTIGFGDDPTLSCATSLGIPAPAPSPAAVSPVTDEHGNPVEEVWAAEWPSFPISAPMPSVSGAAIPGYVRHADEDGTGPEEEEPSRPTLIGPPPSAAIPPVAPAPLDPPPGAPHPRRR